MRAYGINKLVVANGQVHPVRVHTFFSDGDESAVAEFGRYGGVGVFALVNFQFKQGVSSRKLSRFVRRRGQLVLTKRGNAVSIPVGCQESVQLVHNVKTVMVCEKC